MPSASPTAELPAATEESAASLAEIQKAMLDKPDDPELLAQVALAQDDFLATLKLFDKEVMPAFR